ncbi:efflux RND transporter periplasmic adaptor subunit [Algibacillus agarilyticus]|uniref:efflux RND transporter periplasmic adaptor subunit n=1 Tax=Algibacillus agarilyticus TaxID=2234133 RepID=UPI000DD0AC08|nr:efflux RND transporter periplasmic adaptor subunit [Algibacillus agarilyticus]
MFKTKLINALPFLSAVVCIVIALQLLDFFKPEAEKKQYKAKKVKVFVEQSKQKTTQLFAFSQGEVVPKAEIDLKSRVEGRLIYIAPNFVAGGSFKTGDVLMRIDPDDYLLVVTQREAKVAQANQAFAKVKAQAEIAQHELLVLGRENANDLARWLPQLEHAKAEVKAAQALLAQAKLDLSRTEIKAPFNGAVRNEKVSVGHYVARNNTLATLYANEVMEVSLGLNGEQLNIIDLPLNFYSPDYTSGIPVELSADIGSVHYNWQARIVRTEGAIDRRTRTLNVVAEVRQSEQASNQPIIPGLYVNAKISGRVIKNATTLTRTALRKNNQIWWVDDNDRLQIQTVNVIARDSEKVIVKDLANKTLIVTSSLTTPTPGIQVKKLKQTSKSIISATPADEQHKAEFKKRNIKPEVKNSGEGA